VALRATAAAMAAAMALLRAGCRHDGPMAPEQRSTLDDRLAARSAELTPAERRVAEVVAAHRELVAFGTVAELARRAGASGASVIRLSDRLGYRGFRAMQDAVRSELTTQLRPAREKIRRPIPGDLIASVGDSAAESVRRTFDQIDPLQLERVAELIAQRRRRVLVVAGDAGAGIGRQVVTHLSMLRDGVESVAGGSVAAGRQLAGTRQGDVLLCIDLPRHDRDVVRVAELARMRAAAVVVIVDSPLSPLAEGAEAVFPVESHDVGPFDSYVGVLALSEALVAATARRLRSTAAERLDEMEQIWDDLGAIGPT